MIMITNFLKNLFRQPTVGKRHLVIYDADQVANKVIKNIHTKIDHSQTRSIVFSTNTYSKDQKLEHLEWNMVSSIAKEAADIAMVAATVQEICQNKSLKEVHYFSSDADSVGAAVTISDMFPEVKFFVYSFSNRPKSKRLIRNLPENVSHVYVHAKS